MGDIAAPQDTKKEAILKLPPELVCQIADRAKAMHVSFDAAAAVLLQYGLRVQEQKERELEALLRSFHDSPDDASRDKAFEEIGKTVFNK